MASLKEIQDFLKSISKTNLYKVKIKTDDIELTVQLKPDTKTTQVSVEQPVITKTEPVQQAQPAVKVEKTSEPEPKKEVTKSDLIEITSPLVGTFYRKPSPDKPAFVEVGQKIKKGDVVCIVEAMKIFNEIESEYDGEIVEILVNDASPVEFGQPLFLVKPL